MARDNMIKKMLKRSEVGGTKKIKKTKAVGGNRFGKQLKAKRYRFGSQDL